MADIPEFHLETPRLILTFLDPDNTEHCEFLVRLFNQPLSIKYEGDTGLNTPEKASAFIRNACLYQYREDRYGRAIMYLKPEGQQSPSLVSCRPIGIISLVKGKATDEHSLTVPDLGFSVLEEFAGGKGYATEGAQAMLDYAIHELSLDGVFGFTKETNLAAQRVFQKLGFENRGIRTVKGFGPEATSLVFASKGMSEDLSVYNLKE